MAAIVGKDDYSQSRVPKWWAAVLDEEEEEDPVPAPRPSRKVKGKGRRSVVVDDEDAEMFALPEVPARTTKERRKSGRHDSVSLIDDRALGAKRALQDSPSRPEPVAKRSRSTRSATVDSVPAVSLPLEVTEDEPVPLAAIPTLIGRVSNVPILGVSS